MIDDLFGQVFPSPYLFGVGAGALLALIAGILVQRAGLMWWHRVQEDRMRERIRRIESRWYEARP